MPSVTYTFECLFQLCQALQVMQELVDYTIGPEGRKRRSLSADQPQFKLFDDEGNMVPNATEVMAAWEAKCAADLERANASYQAAQAKFLSNTEALSAIPSRVDQLRARAPSSSLAGHHPSLPSQITSSAGRTMAETLAEAEGIIEFSRKQTAASNNLLEDLMKPEQRQPYR